MAINGLLRAALQRELSTGEPSGLTPEQQERAQLLVDRSARKKDKRTAYYAKVRREKEEAALEYDYS